MRALLFVLAVIVIVGTRLLERLELVQSARAELARLRLKHNGPGLGA